MTSRLVLLRANILLKQSYVSLVLDSHCESLRYALDVLSLDQKHPASLPPGLVTLARLYAGESLVFLDRISEVSNIETLHRKEVSNVTNYFVNQATEFLDPNCVGADVSFRVANGGDDGNNSSSNNNNKNDNNPSSVACRAAFTYNLAVRGMSTIKFMTSFNKCVKSGGLLDPRRAGEGGGDAGGAVERALNPPAEGEGSLRQAVRATQEGKGGSVQEDHQEQLHLGKVISFYCFENEIASNESNRCSRSRLTTLD